MTFGRRTIGTVLLLAATEAGLLAASAYADVPGPAQTTVALGGLAWGALACVGVTVAVVVALGAFIIRRVSKGRRAERQASVAPDGPATGPAGSAETQAAPNEEVPRAPEGPE